MLDLICLFSVVLTVFVDCISAHPRVLHVKHYRQKLFHASVSVEILGFSAFHEAKPFNQAAME